MTQTASSAPAEPRSRFGRPLSDQALAKRVAAGDDAAFEALYTRHSPALYRFALSQVRDPEDAKEALQTSMLNAFRALRTGDADVREVQPWLFRITRNACISLLRARAAPAEPLEAHEAPSRVDVAGEVEARDDLRQLRRDLDALSPAQRAAIVLREIEGMDYPAIAAALGTQANAAKHLVHEARRSLVDFGAGRDMACDGVRETIAEGDGRALRSRQMSAHLRECTGCDAFLTTWRSRTGKLAAVFPFPPLLGQEVLQGVMQAARAGAVPQGRPEAPRGNPGGAASSAGVVAAATVAVMLAVGVTALARSQPEPLPVTEGPDGVPVALAGGGGSTTGARTARRAAPARRPARTRPPALRATLPALAAGARRSLAAYRPGGAVAAVALAGTAGTGTAAGGGTPGGGDPSGGQGAGAGGAGGGTTTRRGGTSPAPRRTAPAAPRGSRPARPVTVATGPAPAPPPPPDAGAASAPPVTTTAADPPPQPDPPPAETGARTDTMPTETIPVPTVPTETTRTDTTPTDTTPTETTPTETTPTETTPTETTPTETTPTETTPTETTPTETTPTETTPRPPPPPPDDDGHHGCRRHCGPGHHHVPERPDRVVTARKAVTPARADRVASARRLPSGARTTKGG